MDNSDTTNFSENAMQAESSRRVADAARSVGTLAKDTVAEKLGQESEKAASSLSSAAEALRRASDDISAEHAWMSSLLNKGASGLDSAAQNLEGGNIQRGLDALSGFARREPAMFLGASLAVGFALARVGKTAIEQSSGFQGNQGVE